MTIVRSKVHVNVIWYDAEADGEFSFYGFYSGEGYPPGTLFIRLRDRESTIWTGLFLDPNGRVIVSGGFDMFEEFV